MGRMLRLSDSGSVCPIYLRNWFVDKKLARFFRHRTYRMLLYIGLEKIGSESG